jgi:hypothetical protein
VHGAVTDAGALGDPPYMVQGVDGSGTPFVMFVVGFALSGTHIAMAATMRLRASVGADFAWTEAARRGKICLCVSCIFGAWPVSNKNRPMKIDINCLTIFIIERLLRRYQSQ